MSARTARFADLENSIGHSFADKELLELAFTHISAVPAGAKARLGTYQRLEFLGDRILGALISAWLYERYPSEEEGDLSRRYAHLVRAETCAAVAHEAGLVPLILLGQGEAQAGTRKRAAIHADVCEALIGALYLDGGEAAAFKFIRQYWQSRIAQDAGRHRDAKTQAQEWAQQRGLPIPHYEVMSRTGPDHAPHFCIAIRIEGFSPIQGEGASKRMAEQNAAAAFLAEHEKAGKE